MFTGTAVISPSQYDDSVGVSTGTRDDPRLAADDGAEDPHHVLVAHQVGAADVVDAARRIGVRRDADQVFDQVLASATGDDLDCTQRGVTITGRW